MPELRKPRPEDSHSRARAAKNSPERRAKMSRGPKASRPRGTTVREEPLSDSSGPGYTKYPFDKVRDDERVRRAVCEIIDNFVQTHTDLSTLQFIRVSEFDMAHAIGELKNTRFRRLPTFINDILREPAVYEKYGHWSYFNDRNSDFILMKMPHESKPVTRMRMIKQRVGSDFELKFSTEDFRAELVEYDEEADEDTTLYSMTIAQLQYIAESQGFMCPKDAGWNDRRAIIACINNKGEIE